MEMSEKPSLPMIPCLSDDESTGEDEKQKLGVVMSIFLALFILFYPMPLWYKYLNLFLGYVLIIKSTRFDKWVRKKLFFIGSRWLKNERLEEVK